MRSTMTLALCLAVRLALLAPSARAQQTTPELALRDAIAGGLTDVATWCQRKGWDARAAEHVTEALKVAPRFKPARALRKTLGTADDPSAAVRSAYRRIWDRQVAPKLGAWYLKLARLRHTPAQQAVWDGYLIRALQLSPRRAERTFESAWRAAEKAGDAARVQRLLTAVAAVETSARVARARTAALERTAPPAARIANALVALATWCQHEAGLTGRASQLLSEALHHQPRHAAGLKLKGGDVVAGGHDITKVPDPQAAYAERWSTLAPTLATLYLARSREKGATRRRWDEVYLCRAYELDPKAHEAAFEAAWQAAEAKPDPGRVYRLLTAVRHVASAEAIAARRVEARAQAEVVVSATTPVLRTVAGHRMRYWISLPNGWSKDQTWPVLVACDGRLCVFKGRCASFMRHRGARKVIVISPVTFANTNDLKATLTGFDGKTFTDKKPKDKYLVPVEYHTPEQRLQGHKVQHYPDALLDAMNPDRVKRMRFDRTGLLAVLDDVQRRWSGARRVFITGWSGGGILTWTMVFGHPDRLAGAAPACANCVPQLHLSVIPGGQVSTAAERVELPVVAVQGLKDRYLHWMNPQWEAGKRLAEASGYRNVRRVDLPTLAHVDCAKQVWQFVDDVLAGKTRGGK